MYALRPELFELGEPPDAPLSRAGLRRWSARAQKVSRGGKPQKVAMAQLAAALDTLRAGCWEGAFGGDYAQVYLDLLAWLPWLPGLRLRRTDTFEDADASDPEVERRLAERTRRSSPRTPSTGSGRILSGI